MDDSHEDYDINSQEDRDGTNQQGNAAPEEDEEIEMPEQFLLEEFPADDFLPTSRSSTRTLSPISEKSSSLSGMEKTKVKVKDYFHD